MILNEREMQMAKELARELVRVEKEKQRKQFEEGLNNMKNKVIEIWEVIKNTWENAFKSLHDLDEKEIKRSNWHVPIKIDIPPMPNLEISHNLPRFANARSDI